MNAYDRAFIIMKAAQCGQVDSCSLPPNGFHRVLWTSCRYRVIPLRHLSNSSDQISLRLSGALVNALETLLRSHFVSPIRRLVVRSLFQC